HRPVLPPPRDLPPRAGLDPRAQARRAGAHPPPGPPAGPPHRPPPRGGGEARRGTAWMIAQLPADEAVRRRLREDFDTTFFVEAGAGTGKTTTLVDRIVALVASGRLRAPELVAITFTEAAAAELRARVREELEKDGSPAVLAAAASLDEAAIDTIHAFAGSLLRTYPLEAGLPPSFETLDQIEQDLEFRERFRTWFEAAAEDEKSSKAIKNALLLKLTPDKIESIARALHEHYDLVQSTSSWPAP